MPIYEYYCPSCQKTFDMQRRMADRESPATCPHCQAEHTNRVMSSFMMAGDLVGAPQGGCGSCTPSPGGCAACGVKN